MTRSKTNNKKAFDIQTVIACWTLYAVLVSSAVLAEGWQIFV